MGDLPLWKVTMIARVVCTPGVATSNGGCVVVCDEHGLRQGFGFRHRAAEQACSRHNDTLHRTRTSAPPAVHPSPRQVRAWAIANGYALRATGRIPEVINLAYAQQA